MNEFIFFKGKVYEWGRFRNTGSHTRTKIIPKLPPTRFKFAETKNFEQKAITGYNTIIDDFIKICQESILPTDYFDPTLKTGY